MTYFAVEVASGSLIFKQNEGYSVLSAAIPSYS